LTASHNPKQWNGLKFVRADGIFLPEEEAQKLIDLYYAVTAEDILKAREGRLNVETDVDMAQIHLKNVLNYVDQSLIKNAKLKVVIDTCCGAGAVITPKLLEALGVEYTQINAEPDIEKCGRNLEPIAANLQILGETVRATGAVVGFAQDPDGDRLAIVNEKGEAIGEDYTLCLVAEYLLALAAQGKVHGEKAICTNLSTTRIIDDVAKKFGAEVVRTKIGEVNVSLAMKRTKAVTGGEGNGGIMVPAIGFGRDSLAGIALLLQYLAESKKTVSELVAQNPKYVMYKTKIDCTSDQQVKDILAVLEQRFAQEKLDKQDGLKVIFADGNWLHVRASNTEPIIRIIAEAETTEKAQALAQQAL
jgi:phosphomannomutase